MALQKIRRFFLNKPLNLLLLVLPLTIISKAAPWPDLWQFILSGIVMIPLAGLIGEATESLAEHTGPRIGGLLNATLGNAAELIITLVAIRAGLLDLVKASITGSILGNLLLVMGCAMLYGGFKHGIQTFDRRQAGNNAILLIIVTIALVIPSLFNHSIEMESPMHVEALSLGVAAVMLALYILGMVYMLRQPASANPLGYQTDTHAPKNRGGILAPMVLLSGATIGVVFASEILVGSVEHVTANLGLSQFFLGIILIPLIGNVAEHLVAVQVAGKNHMELSIEIVRSSSLQIALLVAPLLVFVSLAMGNPLTLVFNQFELLALVAAVVVAALVAADGESNWLEGAGLLAVYLILGIGFFLLPV